VTSARPRQNLLRYGAFAVFLGFAVWLALGVAPSALGLYRLYFPPDTDQAWDSNVGWRLCNKAIADWQRKPTPACWKLMLCENEGALNDEERARLRQMEAEIKCEP
jgi:hypothetical protein